MARRPSITETTRKNLMDAFWKLYLTKPVERISVKEITDMAGYNRGTFYLYFRDIYDVLENIEDNVLDIMDSEINNYREILKSSGTVPDVKDIASAAVDIFHKCDYKPLILMNKSGNSRFELILKEKMRSTLNDRVSQTIDVDEQTREYIVHFFMSGILGVLKKWYDDGMKISVEEHLSLVCNVLFDSKNRIKSE